MECYAEKLFEVCYVILTFFQKIEHPNIIGSFQWIKQFCFLNRELFRAILTNI